MAEFLDNFNCLKPSLPFVEMDPSFELMMAHFAELNGTDMENSSEGLMGFSSENCLSHLPEFSMPFADNLPSFLSPECAKPITISQPVASDGEQSHGDRKRKAKAAPETSSANSSEPRTQSCIRDDKSKKKTVCFFCPCNPILFLFYSFFAGERDIKECCVLLYCILPFRVQGVWRGGGAIQRKWRSQRRWFMWEQEEAKLLTATV